jgi:peptide deformylase
MATRLIREIGDPVLIKQCKEVKEMTDRTKELIEDMFDTMYEADGVGLAAPQVGILKRIFVIDVTGEDPMVFINPEILSTDGEQTGYEGCLSLPDLYGIVTRPEYVKVRAFDRFGNEFTVDGHGLTARAFCHETDHLEGKIFSELTDKLLSSEDIDAIEAMKEEEKSGKA